jgi:8-oxo-dGTP pyrophosphatase MutT (NUDIX family)
MFPRDPTRTAGAVVFRRTDEGVFILIVRIGRSWDFPRGGVHANENSLDAARREVIEQTGLADLELPFGDAHRETIGIVGQPVASYYLAETQHLHVDLRRAARQAGRAPADESRWVTFEEAEDFLPPRLAVILDWARERIEEE